MYEKYKSIQKKKVPRGLINPNQKIIIGSTNGFRREMDEWCNL